MKPALPSHKRDHLIGRLVSWMDWPRSSSLPALVSFLFTATTTTFNKKNKNKKLFSQF